MKILLAIVGSTYSDATVDEVVRRRWPVNCDVRIISAIRPLSIPAVEPSVVPPTYFDAIDRFPDLVADLSTDIRR
jgi:hypothetical protein